MPDNHNQATTGDPDSPSQSLPERPNLDHLREQAKDLITAFREGSPEARRRLASALPSLRGISPDQLDDNRLSLHDAQSAIAREYGFESWTKLVRHVEELRAREGISAEVADKFVKAALSDGTGTISRLLELYPGIPRFSPLTALVCGEGSFIEPLITNQFVTVKLAPNGWTPLEYVCYSRVHQVRPESYEGQLRTAELLLDAGADPNTSHPFDPSTESPLSVLYGACDQSCHIGIENLLLERGAKPDDGESVYHAAQHNRPEILEALLKHGADISSAHPHWGNTPLYFLAGHRNSDAGLEESNAGCKWLLEHGADPNVLSNKCQETPLHAAARSANTELVRLLLQHRAAPNIPNEEGVTPYMFAAVTGSREAANLLADAGANTDLPPTAQFLADCAAGESGKVRARLAAEPGLIESLRPKERAVLCKLAELGVTEGVRACLEAGFPADTIGESGATALHFACYRGWAEAASLLIQHGAPLEARDEDYDSSPLGWALEGMIWNPNSKGDFVRIVKELLAAGASDENLKARLASDDAEQPAMKDLMESFKSG